MTKTAFTTKKLYSFGFTLLFTLSLFSAMPFATGATNTGVELSVVGPDGTTAVNTLFGPQPGTILVKMPNFVGTDQRDVFPGKAKISTSATNFVLVDLLETAPLSNRFIGSFVASTDPTSTTGNTEGLFANATGAPAAILGKANLQVAGTLNEITVTLVPSNAAAATIIGTPLPTYTLSWAAAATGVLQVFQSEARDLSQNNVPILGWDDKIFFTLRDKDLDRTAQADIGTLRVWSDSDPVGENIGLVEGVEATHLPTAHSEFFFGNLGFESASAVPNNQLLFVKPNDFVYVRYDDAHNAQGWSEPLAPFVTRFFASSDGTIGFATTSVSGLFVPGQTTGAATNATLMIIDLDMDNSLRTETVVVDIMDGNSIVCKANLYQSATRGVYFATLTFAKAAVPASVSKCTEVDGGSVIPLGTTDALLSARHTIRAVYDDVNRLGVHQARSATITWIPSTDGQIILGGSVLPQRFAGTAQAVQVRVLDKDANVNPTGIDVVNVRVRSDADPSVGIIVPLTEQTADSGDFSGSFMFSKTGGPGLLKVADGSFLQAHYFDSVAADGLPLMVASAKAVWRDAVNGVVRTDETQYFYALRADNPNPNHPNTAVRIYVDDQDQNDPRVKDTITVTGVRLPNQAGARVVLEEIGVDSGVFVGEMLFSEVNGDPDPARLYVGDRDSQGFRAFRIQYSDPAGGSGFPAEQSSPTLQFRKITDPNVRVIRLEAVERLSPADIHNVFSFRTIDNVSVSRRGNSRPAATPAILAVYTAPGLTGDNRPVVEMHSTWCPEDNSFRVSDADTGTGIGSGTGGALNDGRYATIIGLHPATGSDACDTGTSVGVQGNTVDTVTVRSGPGVQISFRIHDTKDPSTKLFTFDNQPLGSGAFAAGQERGTYVQVTAPNDNQRRFLRDVTFVDVQTISDAFPRQLKLVETGDDTSIFRAAILHRNTSTLVNDPVSLYLRATNGVVISDLIPGPIGDTCSGTVQHAVPGPGTAAPGGLTCFEINRQRADGTLSTLALAGSATSLRLTSGPLIGPQGVGGRCAPHAPMDISTPLPALSTPVIPANVFSCAELQGTGGVVLGALGEPTFEPYSHVTGVSGTFLSEMILTNGVSIPDGRYGGSLGDVCNPAATMVKRSGQPLTVDQSKTVTCIQYTRYNLDGTPLHMAITLTNSAILGATGPTPPTADDPTWIYLNNTYLRSGPGTGGHCSPDPTGIVIKLPLTTDLFALPAAGLGGCLEINSDAVDTLCGVGPLATACAPGTHPPPPECAPENDLPPEADDVNPEGQCAPACDPLLDFGCVDGNINDEDLDFHALGQRMIVSVMATQGERFIDTANHPGARGDTCVVPEDSRVWVAPGPARAGAFTCLQFNMTLPNGDAFTMAFDIVPGISMRFGSSFVVGPEGLGGSCGPPSMELVALFSVGSATSPVLPPTCVEMMLPQASKFAGTYAFGWERRDPSVALMGSELQRSSPTVRADGTTLAVVPGVGRNQDGIRIAGRGHASAAWFEAHSASLRIANEPVGANAFIDLWLSGDDLLSNRVHGEHLGTASIEQKTFQLSSPYVPGSEVVYDNETFVGEQALPNVDGNYRFRVEVASRAGGAAEPIHDFNLDGSFTCADVIFTAPPESGSGTRCNSVSNDGIIDYSCGSGNSRGDASINNDCEKVGPQIESWYRLQYDPLPSSIYDYTRPNATQIRLGDFICAPIDAGILLDCGLPPVFNRATFWVDYTPAVQYVTVTSTSTTGPSETETIPVFWDDALKLYHGRVPVETFRQPNDDKIFVSGSTTNIFARFDDPRGDNGRALPIAAGDYRSVQATAVWRRGQDAVMSFYDPTFTNKLTSAVYGSAIPIEVVDIDADRTSQEEHIAVSATMGGNLNSPVTSVLRETGPRTGVFRGFINVGTPTECASIPVGPARTECEANIPAFVMPAVGGQVVVYYQDRATGTGLRDVISQSITWRPAGTGAVKLFNSVTDQAGAASAAVLGLPANDRSIVGLNGALFVSVVDPDANLNSAAQDKVLIRVKSDSEPVGEIFTLNERAGAPGVFDSSAIRFSPTATAGDGRIFARDNGAVQDKVWAEYFDANTMEGRSQIQRSNFIQWDSTDDGEANFDFPDYVGTFSEGPVGAGVRTRAVLSIKDADCNLSPNVVDTITVTPSSGEAACGAGAPNLLCVVVAAAPQATCSASDPHPVTRLVETGPNTGEFVTIITFNGVAADPPLDADGIAVAITNGQRVRALWVDARPAAGNAPSTFLATASWNQRGFGVVNFDLPAYIDETATPIVSLVDADLDTPTGSALDTVTVQLRTTSNLTPPTNVVLTETGAHTGVFRGAFKISTSTLNAAGGTLKVAKADTLEVKYTDNSPSGVRTGTALVNFVDKLAPVTNLTVMPGTPVGKRGVFLDKPSVTLTAVDETGVRDIQFRLGQATAWQAYTDPLLMPEGNTSITFRSIDVLGREEIPQTRFIEVDLTDPTQIPSDVQAMAAAGGSIRLNWTSVPDTLNPSNFFEYVIFREGTADPVGNSTTNEFVDDSLTSEQEQTYRVRVSDKSGRLAPASAAAKAIPDASLPLINGATATPNRFDLRDKPEDGIIVGAQVTDNALKLVKADLVLPSGESIATTELAADAGGRFVGNLSISGLNQPCLCNVMFSASDIAGNVGILNVSVTILGPDGLAPDATLETANVPLGQPLNVTVSDNLGLTRVSYALDSGAAVTVDVPAGAPVVKFQVPAAILSLGPHTLRIEAADNATTLEGDLLPNNMTKTLNFTVVVGPDGVSQPSFFLVTRARQLANGTMLVEWDVPAELAGVAGFQVWRSSSPFELVGTLNDAGRRSFHDSSVQTGKTYRYAVSFFTGSPFENIAQVPGYPGSDDGVPTSNGVEAKSPQGVLGQGWLWWVIGALALVAVAALIAVAVARRGNTQQQTVMQPAPAAPTEVEATTQEPATVATDLHRLRCPECAHRFEVNGTRPIVTNCPNCGRKGILR